REPRGGLHERDARGGAVNRLRTLAARLDDAVSPIVIRELRQAVRGRSLAVILLLFLVVELIALGLATAGGQLFFTGYDGGRELGGTVFTVLFRVLLFTTLLFVPLYTAVRMTLERGPEHLDLLFATPLTPRAIS